MLGLRFVAGLTHHEIGQLLGLTDANVGQIVHRAVVKLRRRFTQEEAS
jgi:DNA-directed RNA polymerase specialized sigma24 family protein